MAQSTRRLDPVYAGETWQEDILVTDENGVAFDLTGAAVSVEVFHRRSRTQALSASIGSGVSMPAIGIIEWVFTADQTGSLCAGAYPVKITVTRDGTVLVLENFTVTILSGDTP